METNTVIGNTDTACYGKEFYEEDKQMTKNKWKMLSHTKNEIVYIKAPLNTTF